MDENGKPAEMNWDLSSYFPGFPSEEYERFKRDLSGEIKSLGEKASELDPLRPENLSAWKDVFLETEKLVSRYSHINSYVGCLAAADSNREDYLGEEAAVSLLGAELEKLEVQLKRALRDADDEMFSEFVSLPGLSSASYYLGRVRKTARRAMSAPEEILAADLGVDGISAWGRLYDAVSSKMTFEMAYPDGTVKTLPMSQRRSLMENPKREVRKAAFSGGNAAWEALEDVAAAAVNAISGTRRTLYRHREIDHFLEVALFDAAVSKETIDAMMEAIRENVELPREVLRLKAETLGLSAVSWYDLGAPMDFGEEETTGWERARSMVGDSFSSA